MLSNLCSAGATVDCTRITEAIKALFFIGMTSTTLLFFLRVRAIFANTRYAPAFFFFLWLANVGCSTLDFLLVDGTRLGPTESCIFTNLRKVYAIIPAVAVLVHDTLVFAAISYKLFSHSHFGMSTRDQRGKPGNKTTAFLSGRGLPAFSRTLLQDGQVYYLSVHLLSLLSQFIALKPTLQDFVPLCPPCRGNALSPEYWRLLSPRHDITSHCSSQFHGLPRFPESQIGENPRGRSVVAFDKFYLEGHRVSDRGTSFKQL